MVKFPGNDHDTVFMNVSLFFFFFTESCNFHVCKFPVSPHIQRKNTLRERNRGISLTEKKTAEADREEDLSEEGAIWL